MYGGPPLSKVGQLISGPVRPDNVPRVMLTDAGPELVLLYDFQSKVVGRGSVFALLREKGCIFCRVRAVLSSSLLPRWILVQSFTSFLGER